MPAGTMRSIAIENAALCERRGQLRNELGDLDLLIHREKFGFRGGARWGLSRGCRANYIYAGRERQNPSHAGPLAAVVAFQLSPVYAGSEVPAAPLRTALCQMVP